MSKDLDTESNSDNPQLTQFIKHLSQDHVKFLVLTGAGISTSSGIPDFRSPETGLYHNLSRLQLPYAEAVFDIDYFQKNPNPFMLLCKELYPGQYIPSAFHLFIRLLQDHGKLHRVYTQNIDTLERIAGVDDDLIIEAHGSFEGNHCIECHEEFDQENYKLLVLKGEVVKCWKCQGLVKPDIVFFGESLPKKFFDQWDQDVKQLKKSDQFVALTAGTSLTVYPFASLPSEIPRKIPRILVNLENVGDFKSKPRDSDLLVLGDIEQFILKVIKEAGWWDEYLKLRNEIVEKLGLQTKKETVEEKVDDITKEIEQELEQENEGSSSDDQLDELTVAVETLDLKANTA
ncbi:hypothetical protein WICPIJ_008883 [Wickerhamomyces pijperi]|uniref:NAD-dependent protein deacetylase n=1 Tax=Wickerhamomyces pijperi TaxID=599730 RepID=A0A9P8PTU7_WICPI|nr:hypothetical protein WICPIJ_008883 [Wickerhamomyces pijperi]